MVNCNYNNNGKSCKNKINFYNDYEKGYYITCYRHRACIICKTKIKHDNELCEYHDDLLNKFVNEKCKKVRNKNKIFELYDCDRVQNIFEVMEGKKPISDVKDIMDTISFNPVIKNGMFCISFD